MEDTALRWLLYDTVLTLRLGWTALVGTTVVTSVYGGGGGGGLAETVSQAPPSAHARCASGGRVTGTADCR
jgi:hypothetical protein